MKKSFLNVLLFMGLCFVISSHITFTGPRIMNLTQPLTLSLCLIGMAIPSASIFIL